MLPRKGVYAPLCGAMTYNLGTNSLPHRFALSAATQNATQNNIAQTIAADMDAVNTVIRQKLHSEVSLVNQIAEYIISAGGKRIRPVLVLLVANAYAYKGTAHHELAALAVLGIGINNIAHTLLSH